MNRQEGKSAATHDVCVRPSLWDLRGKRLRTAAEAARQTLWRDPSNEVARCIVARACFDRGDDTEAIRLLHQAIYDAPGQYAARDLLSRILRSAGRHDDALQVYIAWGAYLFHQHRLTKE